MGKINWAFDMKYDIENHFVNGSWRTLERLAVKITKDASKTAKSKMNPVLGGGTRLMIDMKHRISDDIDLFINNPQWIGYLTPRLNDRFENEFDSYDEGSTSLKLKTPIGEIDFIVSMSLLGLPNERSNDCVFELEPIAEVLVKKLFYRGWALTPRDLFDWKMIESKLPTSVTHITDIAKLLSGRTAQITNSLIALKKSTRSKTIWDAIKANDLPDFHESIDWAEKRIVDFNQINISNQKMAKAASGIKLPKSDGPFSS